MLDHLSDQINRPGRVVLYFGVLVTVYSVADAVYLSLTTGMDLWRAIVDPPYYDLFTRVVVVMLALLAAVVGEIAFSRYRRTSRELSAERARLRALYEGSPSAIMCLDHDFNVEYVNRRAEKLVGHAQEDVAGKQCYAAFFGLESPCEGCLVGQVFETGETHSRIKHEVTAGGQENWLSQIWYPLFAADGSVESVVEIASDVSDVKLDALTGLPNRMLLRDRLDVALASAQRHGQSIAILFVDIDGFKDVNDQFGHAAGDALLVDLAHRLRSAIRKDETLARLGGDEFVLLVPTVRDQAEAERVARRLIENLRLPFLVAGKPRRVTVSVGVSVYAGGDTSAADIIEAADAAMYEAKNSGGNAYRTHPGATGFAQAQRV